MGIGVTELLIILAIVVLLFGTKNRRGSGRRHQELSLIRPRR